MPDDANLRLREALGVTQPIRLAVSSESQPRPDYIDIEDSFALLGRGAGCDVVLPDPAVSFRHAYLQAFGDRVLCVDLLSASGIQWDGPYQQGWLTPAHRLQIGSSRVQLLDDGWNAEAPDWRSPLECKTREHNVKAYGQLPDVHLELSNRKLKGMTWPINRVLTLLGRDPRCRITCGDERISRVHCSLLLTPVGLWIIDLLGRGGITVNGQRLAVALLQEGDELVVGQYRMKAVYESPPEAAVEEPAAPGDTTEFPVAAAAVPRPAAARQRSAPPTTRAVAAPHVASLPAPEFLTRNNRIFPVEFVGETIIVSPRGGIRNAPYQQMQLEANIITQLLQTRPGLKNVVVDVGATDAMDSIIISCVSMICRSARHKASICHCSVAMLDVLTDMSLTKVWPYFETRQDALEFINS
jgi:pSer/pThr/pTyr-binding forkhead associated (FHA) protein